MYTGRSITALGQRVPDNCAGDCQVSVVVRRTSVGVLSYSKTTVYYEIHECNECISVDCGLTNLIHDRRSCVDITLEVRRSKREQARCDKRLLSKCTTDLYLA